jgi:WD40 repeat protein
MSCFPAEGSPVSPRTLRILLTTAAFLQTWPADAQKAVEHKGRREQDTPGLVLETGARTAACDMLTFTADGKHLLAAGDDKVVRTWAVSDDGRLGLDEFPTLRWPIFREMRGNIYTAALSPDESRIIVAGHGRLAGGFAAAVIDRMSGELLHGTDNPGQEQQGTVWASGFSPSGKRVALGTVTGAVWVWDLTSGKLTRVGKHDPPAGGDPWLAVVRLAAFDGEDRVISVGGNGEMCAWDVGKPHEKKLLHTFAGPITVPVAHSRDGSWVGVVPERPSEKRFTVELVSFPDADKQRKLYFNDFGELPHRVAFSSSSRYLAVAVRRVGRPDIDPTVTFYQERGGRVLVYDLNNPDGELKPTPGPAQGLYAEGLAFHPKNDNWLAVAGGDNHEVQLWDWKANRLLGEVAQPGRSLWGVALSPDGNTVAFQDRRHHVAPHPNRRGTGPWRYFDLANRRFVDGTPFVPQPSSESPSGWKVDTNTRHAHIWHVISPAGVRYPLPWDRTADEFPRCYAFIPRTKTAPERLAIGHYWGVSIFDLTSKGPIRTRALRGHEGYVSALAVSADGMRLVTSSRDMTLAGWSLEDWPHHPRLGAELFERGGNLVVGKVAPGSPLWEMGLDTGDGIEAILVADHALPGQAKAKVVYDRRVGQPPVGTPGGVAKYLRAEDRPGVEHLFYWKSPNDPQLYAGLTTVVDRPLWRFFPHGDREWVLWQWRDYYYDCSLKGDYSIGWQRSYELHKLRRPDFFRAEQFRGEFLRPDKLANTLTTWQSDQAVIRFNEIEPPGVEVSEPSSIVGGYEVIVTIRPQGSLENQQPGQVLVWLNDYLVADLKGEDLRDRDRIFRKTVTIPGDKLRHGENIVIAQCYARGGARADSNSRTIHRGGPSAERTLHALLVGVGDYHAARPRQVALRAADDASVLARAFQAQKGRGLFADVRVKPLLDATATRTAILSELHNLRDQVKPDDLLVFHLGGHGTSLAELRRKKIPERKLAGLGRFLFMCSDFDLDRMPDTTVGFEDLHDLLAQLPCHKLILLDACHSGEARTAGGDTDANPVRILTRRGVGSAILAACGPDEEAIENDALDPIGGGHGLFAIALRRLLEEPKAFAAADRDGNGLLDAAELGAGLGELVKELVAEHNDLLRRLGEKGDDRQTPVVFIPRLEEQTPIAGKSTGRGGE